MSRNRKLSRWIVFGLLGIPPVLVIYFYLLLHLGLGVPLRDILYPAAAFCAFVPIFSAGTYWGTRERAKGNRVPLIVVIGAFTLLCGVEFTYFENKLNHRPTEGYGFAIVWAVTGTVAGYFLDKSIAAVKKRRDLTQ